MAGRLTLRAIVCHTAILGLAGVFAFSGVMKILAPREFANALCGYDLLPRSTISPIAIVLPWLELVAGVSVLVLPLRRASTFLMALMAACFAFSVVWAMALGLDPNCGCFGLAAIPVDWKLLSLDVTLFLAAVLLVVRKRSPCIALRAGD